jgi:hypothetical protein
MRRCLPALVLSLVVLALAPACGGSDKKPVEVLSAATSKTVDSKSSRVALTIDTTPTAATGNKAGKIVGDGAFDYTSRQGTLTMDTSAMGIPGFSGTIELILLGDVFYMKLPPGILGSKPWLKIDLATLGQQSGIDLAGLQELGSNDPAANLQFLRGASDKVEKVGSAEVRGVDTTQYHLVVDLEKAKTKVPENLQDDIDRIIKQIGASTYPADVWIDDHDLIRRLRFSFAGAGGTDGAAATVTQEFYDFGVAVSAEAPPADQVNDFGQLLNQLGQAQK